jgi:hypothetical protein
MGPVRETINVGEVLVYVWNSKELTDTAVWRKSKGLLLQYESKQYINRSGQALRVPGS